MSTLAKLKRMKNHLNLNEADSIQIKETTMHEEIPYIDKWTEFSTKPYFFESSYALVREVKYPIDYKHGDYLFSELNTVVQKWNQSKMIHPLSSKGYTANDLLFFDTETTGLHNGAGNVIFLLGIGQLKEEYFVVKQYFLPEAGSEVSMYQKFLADVGFKSDLKLTTYNGKAFDWPQLKTRHTLLRDLVPKLPPFGHFDLLHASRRLWKSELESCRLSIIEQEILNVKRDGDVPGFLAPMIYFDFLKDPNPVGIKGVFTHNEFDILTLVSLYIHLSNKCLANNDDTLTDNELFQLARWSESLNELDLAYNYYEKLDKRISSFQLSAKKGMAKILKKQKRTDEAIRIWEELLKSGSMFADIETLEELSKAYEHYLKDYNLALDVAKKGYQEFKKLNVMMRTEDKKRATLLKKRIARLEEKLGKTVQN